MADSRQRNVGLPASMDPGSPSATSLGRPGIRCYSEKEKSSSYPRPRARSAREPGSMPRPESTVKSLQSNAPSPWGGPGWGLLAMQEPKSQSPIRGRTTPHVPLPTSHSPRPTPHVPLPTSRINNPPPTFGHLPQGGGLLLSETKLFEHWGAALFLPPLGEGRGGGCW